MGKKRPGLPSVAEPRQRQGEVATHAHLLNRGSVS